MTLKERYKALKKFLKEDIWDVQIENLGRIKRKMVLYLQALIVTMRTFSKQKIGYQSVALSFFCTMATVPLIAVIFSISGGLGIAERLRELLYANFPNSSEVIESVLQYADNMLETAASSTLGLISFLIFFWLILWMMIQVEKVFNNVWNVSMSRKLWERTLVYFILIVLSPFVALILFSGPVTYSHILSFFGVNTPQVGMFNNILGWIFFWVLSSLIISVMYKFIPCCKVRYIHALVSAAIAGFAFTILQYFYLETQIFITRLSAVYGTVAAVPLFMFWLNFSWFIILFGCELCYAYQSVKALNDNKAETNGKQE
ncbi:MAG: YihY/virulence factor BrkB family protein [Bacteroidales bacterium]|nr:YihY/virulence factor BrkB family protein [Bacteroidales bacterium]